jgi:hypothetical protein
MSIELAYLGVEVGGTVATLDPDVDGHLADADGVFTGWLRSHDATGVLTRPDQYVFGSTSESRQAGSLVEQLRQALS